MAFLYSVIDSNRILISLKMLKFDTSKTSKQGIKMYYQTRIIRSINNSITINIQI